MNARTPSWASAVAATLQKFLRRITNAAPVIEIVGTQESGAA
jgi:hypothetical protein